MLKLLAVVYGWIIRLRNVMYDRGIFDIHDLPARTISVGNITAGGTGKTPLVAYIAELLAARGEIVCILTRGYGRANPKTRVLVSDGRTILNDPNETGDEPLELAKKLLGKAVVIADAHRFAAGEWAKRKFGVTVFVLDDGFQHREVRRDVDIVCIDATNPFGGGEMLPAGRLRESLSNLSRATAIVVTRSNLVDKEAIADLRSEISELNAGAPVFTAKDLIREIISIDGSAVLDVTTPVFAFCGLGNPESFFASIKNHGLRLTGTHAFADHHSYTQADIDSVVSKGTASGASAIITTGKDAVKLSTLKIEVACFVVQTTLEISDAETFAKML